MPSGPRCRERRTSSSWRRATGAPGARTAGSSRTYLAVLVIHRSYPQAVFSTWGQVDNEARLGRQIALQATTGVTGAHVTLRPLVPLVRLLERPFSTRKWVSGQFGLRIPPSVRHFRSDQFRNPQTFHTAC